MALRWSVEGMPYGVALKQAEEMAELQIAKGMSRDMANEWAKKMAERWSTEPIPRDKAIKEAAKLCRVTVAEVRRQVQHFESAKRNVIGVIKF